MAALTDLAFEQLVAQFDGDGEPFFVGEDTAGNIGVMISLTALNGTPVDDLTSTGVVKSIAKLIDIARKAQDLANEAQAEGEKLNAFPAATSSGTVVNGYIEVTDSLKSRIVVSSATQIEGATI